MKNLAFVPVAAILSLVFITSCAVNNSQSESKIEVDELVFATDPEPVKGKLDVYKSMARGVKYNVDVASQNLNKKIYSPKAAENPHEVIDGIIGLNTGNESPLYDASKILEYAVIYSMASLSDNRAFNDAYFYAKASQHLALATIRAHKDTLFANKKIREIQRIMAKEQKILNELNNKMRRNGTLNAEDLEYKKGLEVALLKLSELKSALAYSIVEYTQLVKADAKGLELEGRQFYELEDFDKKYTIDTFQAAAVRNRTEIAKAKEAVKAYGLDEMRAMANKDYPEIERLDINGLDVEDEVYNKKLQERALKIANNLVDAVTAYRAAKPKEQPALRQKAYDLLGVAVLAQVEVAYNIVKLADYDYDAVQLKAKALRKEVRDLAKSYRLTSEQKVDLLDKQISLLDLDLKANQISGERAMALRSLYFYAGLSPFDKALLKLNIMDLSNSLKKSFNKDLVEMLAASPKDAQSGPLKYTKYNGNEWAKQDNWLEILIDGKPQAAETGVEEKAANKSVAAVKENAKVLSPTGNFDPYTDPKADKLRTLQLGSYLYKENADLEWKQLIVLYPELNKYSPRLERAKVEDALYYRLIINSPDGGFRSLCNKLRGDKVECILK